MYSTNYTDSGAVAYCLRVVHTWLKEHNNYKREDSRRLLHHCYLRLVMLYDIISTNWWVWLNSFTHASHYFGSLTFKILPLPMIICTE